MPRVVSIPCSVFSEHRHWRAGGLRPRRWEIRVNVRILSVVPGEQCWASLLPQLGSGAPMLHHRGPLPRRARRGPATRASGERDAGGPAFQRWMVPQSRWRSPVHTARHPCDGRPSQTPAGAQCGSRAALPAHHVVGRRRAKGAKAMAGIQCIRCTACHGTF